MFRSVQLFLGLLSAGTTFTNLNHSSPVLLDALMHMLGTKAI